jgi:hypothetical protein
MIRHRSMESTALIILSSQQVFEKKPGHDVGARGMEAEGTDVTCPQGLSSNLSEMERSLLPRFQPNETESRHSASRILLRSKSLEPNGDEACSSTVV